jgi:hypothetical protein
VRPAHRQRGLPNPAHAEITTVPHAPAASSSRDVNAARLSQIAERGLEPAEHETYANGVRKVIFRDPDGNEIGFGGAPA